jgi:hypothetical protein
VTQPTSLGTLKSDVSVQPLAVRAAARRLRNHSGPGAKQPEVEDLGAACFQSRFRLPARNASHGWPLSDDGEFGRYRGLFLNVLEESLLGVLPEPNSVEEFHFLKNARAGE